METATHNTTLRSNIFKLRVELGTARKYIGYMVLDDISLELQKADLALYNCVKNQWDRFKNEGDSVLNEEDLDYFSKLQYSLDSVLILKADVANLLKVSVSAKEHRYLSVASHRLNEAIKLLSSDDIIPID